MKIRRIWWSIGGIAVMTLVFVAVLVAEAGAWLMVEDPLRPAAVVAVFGGGAPFRAMEAARIYKEGAAREVWLTEGGWFLEDVELGKLGINRTPEHTYSWGVLTRMGVPDVAIRVLPERNNNTAQEVQSIAEELDRAGFDGVILVTSSYHTRRVKTLWRKLVGDKHPAIVRYTPDDPFQPHRWWRDAGDSMHVAREWFGLINVWAGFPVKSEHW
jgi:uncharacterized SAM-binding protein YcdF (DUF218 family)